MIPSIVSSLILINKRRTLSELITPSLRKLLEEWELRLMILLSLTLQIVLIIFGNRRRHDRKLWIRIVVWSTYLVADSVATFALGLVKGKLDDMYDNAGRADSSSLDANIEITAFWAPFLLLHLGGPDTITAYSLEDNELWLRHLLGLFVQAAVAFVVFYMAWTGSLLSILAILMTLSGLIKYVERNWVLRSNSNQNFRNSTRTNSLVQSNHELKREFELKQLEGFVVTPKTVVMFPMDKSIFEKDLLSIEDEILTAYGLSEIIKRLFADALLSSRDHDTSPIFFKMSSNTIFRVIEIELGSMFDLLYTKAMLVYSHWGIVLRIFNFSLIFIVLMCFSFSDKHKYSKVDVSITFILLAVAILLEIYAALLLLFSDKAVAWFSKHRKTSSLRAVTSLSLIKGPRWSNSMGQFSILSYLLREKHMFFPRISKLLQIDELLENQIYTYYKPVPDELKEWIFTNLKKALEEGTEGRISFTGRGSTKTTRENNQKIVKMIQTLDTEVEFNGRILVWHIVTELCLSLDRPRFDENIPRDVLLKCKMSKYISRYMLYLSTMCSEMLPPAAIRGQVNFHETCAQVLSSKNFPQPKMDSIIGDTSIDKKRRFECSKLLYEEGYADVASPFHRACTMIKTISSHQGQLDLEKWDTISLVWLDMLTYAANQCKGNQHARQLTQGGELLTHVWLLMAHFGLTEHFQKDQNLQSHAILKLIAD